MTRLLREAFDQAARLPEDAQDALAQQLLDDLASEEAWAGALEDPARKLSSLAKEAEAEYREGKTQPLEPDRL